MKKFLLLSLVLIGCQASLQRDPISTNPIRETINTATEIKPTTRSLLSTQLDDLDSRLKFMNESYLQLEERYEDLQDAHKTLQNQFAEAQRDAGYKDTIHFFLWGLVGLIILSIMGYVLWLVGQGKIRVPGLLG
jgi:hypothetical protein